MDLSTFIYDFNLVTTGTAKDVYEKCSIINNGRKKNVEYQNCISLYDIVEKFNNSYIKYKEDKDRFKRIINQLGKNMRYGYHTVSNDFSSLCLEVYETLPNIFNEKYSVIYFVNSEGKNYVSANNGLNMFDKNYKNNIVYLPEEDVTTVLDIVRKHNLFLESLRDLKNKFVFGNGTTVVFTKVDGDIFTDLSNFTLTFGNSYMNCTDYIEIKFKLGENLKVIYDDSKVVLNDEEVIDYKVKIDIINELLSSIYINCEKLNGLYKQEDKEYLLRKSDKNEK